MFPSSSGHRSSNLDRVVFSRRTWEHLIWSRCSAFCWTAWAAVPLGQYFLARDQRFQDLRFLFSTSNLEFMKEEIFFSPPRMPVAIFDRLRIPGALFHFILLAGGVEPWNLAPSRSDAAEIARCVSPAVAGHGRCAEFPSWLKIAGCFWVFLEKYKPRMPRTVEFDGIIVWIVLVYLYFILCMMGMYFLVREEVQQKEVLVQWVGKPVSPLTLWHMTQCFLVLKVSMMCLFEVFGTSRTAGKPYKRSRLTLKGNCSGQVTLSK